MSCLQCICLRARQYATTVACVCQVHSPQTIWDCALTLVPGLGQSHCGRLPMLRWVSPIQPERQTAMAAALVAMDAEQAVFIVPDDGTQIDVKIARESVWLT